MNTEILTAKVQDFINLNLNTDIHKILLKSSPFIHVTSKELVEQIESKKKAEKKLFTWFLSKNIYYPNKLNLSQSSSEITAHYKASLVEGSSLIDLTAGFGVDCLAFSKKIDQVTHVEQSKLLSQIAQHNFKELGITNMNFVSEDSINYLKNCNNTFDWIYIDPSRRDKENKKVYYLTDCEPDITKNLPFFFSKADHLLIKTGPLLDLNMGMKQIENVKEIHIVAVSNEVKEVLWLLSKENTPKPLIKTINFHHTEVQNFNFHINEEKTAKAIYSNPKKYLYEPNAAILKSGAFQYVGQFFNLSKLHLNSHLYTSDQKVDFPGRIFKIEKVTDYSKKTFQKLAIKKANVSTRNFSDSVLKIKRKLNIQDGGEKYLFFTKNFKDKNVVLHCLRA